jgi:ketosteroid isomerase-like protein
VSQENVEVIKEAWRATNRGDVDALLAAMADDVDLRPPSHRLDGTVFRGHAGVRAWMERIKETWSELDGLAHAVASVGEQVVVVIDTRAVGRESGVPIHQRVFVVYSVRNGKIAASIAYSSEHEALRVVGLAEYAMSQENVERYLRGIDAWNRGVLDEWLQETVTPGWEVVTDGAFPGLAATYRGREGAIAMWEALRGPWDAQDHHIEVERHRGSRGYGARAPDDASERRLQRCAGSHSLGSRHHAYGRRSADAKLRELGRRPQSRGAGGVGDVAGERRHHAGLRIVRYLMQTLRGSSHGHSG